MAFAHASLGNLANAIKLTRQARTLAPHDRLIGFNLAGFLRLAGRLDDALEVLKQLRKGARLDIDLALVTADLLAENGQGDEARRVLQGVRTSQEWAVANHVRRAELEANLALLRWMTDRERADATVTALMRALRDSQYRSLSIGYLLANLLRDRKNAQHLATAISGLRAHHDDNELHGLRMHHAVLTRERDEAVHHARAWARHEPLNPAAAALAIHLISDIDGHYDEAADPGRRSAASCPRQVASRQQHRLRSVLGGTSRRGQADPWARVKRVRRKSHAHGHARAGRHRFGTPGRGPQGLRASGFARR